MTYNKRIRGQSSDYRHVGTTRFLTRIVTVLSLQKVPRNITWILDAISAKGRSAKVQDSLHWLVCNNLVFRNKSIHGTFLYSINPAFLEMRGVRRP